MSKGRFLIFLFVVLNGVSSSIWMSGGWKWRIDPEIADMGKTNEKKFTFAEKTKCRIEHRIVGQCASGANKQVLVIGDSHVSAWYDAFRNVYSSAETNLVMLSYLHCNKDFRVFENRIVSNIEKNNCQKKANFLTQNRKFLRNIDYIVLASFRPFSYNSNPFRYKLMDYLEREASNAKIYVLGNYFQTAPEKRCDDIIFRRRSLIACASDEFVEYMPTLEEVKAEPGFDKMVKGKRHYIHLTDHICTDGKCPAIYEGVPSMYDWNHTTSAMTTMIASKLRETGVLDFDGHPN